MLVLSGGTRRDDLDRFAYRPDRVVDSIADLSVPDLAGDAIPVERFILYDSRRCDGATEHVIVATFASSPPRSGAHP